MRHVALGLTCFVVAVGYVAGCGSTSGTVARGNEGGSAGSSTGATGGTAASGGSGATGSGGSGATGSGGSGATGSGGNGATGSGGSGASGAQDAGVPDVIFSYDGPADDGGFNSDASCAEVTAKADPLPLDLYVVLDRSGSMVLQGRWSPVVNALTTFFQSPGAKGIGVALTMFAHPTKTDCSASSYQTPIVGMGLLPGSATGHATTLVNTMNSYPSVSGIGTPTVEAMQGASTFAKNYKNANPTHTVAVVLATDGVPGEPGCSESASGVQSVVSSLYTGTPPIKTYVIGIDPDSTMKANLNSWAAASGTTAFDVGTSGGSSQFLQAMQSIQKSALGCKYNMPTSDAGIVDPKKVSVEYTPGGSSTPQSLPKVSGSGSCGSGGGWYYDNNQNPTTITLCKTTCDTVQADSGAKVAVNLGCLGS